MREDGDFDRQSLVVAESNDPASEDTHGAEEPPRATFAILLCYLVLTAGLWGSVYLLMWHRR